MPEGSGHLMAACSGCRTVAGSVCFVVTGSVLRLTGPGYEFGSGIVTGVYALCMLVSKKVIGTGSILLHFWKNLRLNRVIIPEPKMWM